MSEDLAQKSGFAGRVAIVRVSGEATLRGRPRRAHPRDYSGAPELDSEEGRRRVKTDRKDAARLARCYRAGDLPAVWVPDAATDAARDLVRAREVTKQDQLRARHRVSKFLLRPGYQRPDGMPNPIDTRAWACGPVGRPALPGTPP